MTIPQLHSLFLQHKAVCTDTRNIIPESIFFALKGPSFNANQFAQTALEQGCSYAVVDEKQYAVNDNCILVDNALNCLQQLASFHRLHWGKKIVGLTGSNGKTTTKELIHAVLERKFNCLATVGNLNNHIGVPLTLLSLKPEHEVAVVEMGANHQGEIALLANLAQPDYGVITNIGKAHIEGFGGEEGVLKGKGELYDYLRAHDGTVFINGDDEKLAGISHGLKTITYGYGDKNSVHAQLNDNGLFMAMKITARGQTQQVQTQLTGKYNGINVLCAYAVGLELGVDMAVIKTGIEEYVPQNSRSQVHKTPYNTLILDAYNANPSSMTLAIENLARIEAPNKMVVLGDMREMGTYAREEHLEILKKVSDFGLHGIFVGDEFFFYKNQFPFAFFSNAAEAKNYIQQLQIKDHVVLIKGSRGIKLEQTVEAF